MADLGKYPLDDDELDKVSGGAYATTIVDCNDYMPITVSKPKTCENCSLFGMFCAGKQ